MLLTQAFHSKGHHTTNEPYLLRALQYEHVVCIMLSNIKISNWRIIAVFHACNKYLLVGSYASIYSEISRLGVVPGNLASMLQREVGDEAQNAGHWPTQKVFRLHSL